MSRRMIVIVAAAVVLLAVLVAVNASAQRTLVTTSPKLILTGGLTGSPVQLFGHVTLVEGYAIPTFHGSHSLIALRDTPGKTIAVLSDQDSLQNLLETALATGNLVGIRGQKYAKAPTPLGGTWSVDVYYVTGVTLYNMK